VSALLRRHWRTALGVLLGAAGGALYANFIGCHTGTCAITSSVWKSALFFGFTGGVVAMPGRPSPSEGQQASRSS
jgi:hypothetical protein